MRNLMAFRKALLIYVAFFGMTLLTGCGGGGSSGGGCTTNCGAASAPNVIESSSSANSKASSESSSPSSAVVSSLQNSSSVSSIKALSKIEIRVPIADDWAYLTVNGLRHRIAYWGQVSTAGEWRDISEWFTAGNNEVHLHAINSGGPRGLQFELRVDGVIHTAINCPSTACPDGTEAGTFYQGKIDLPSLNLPLAGKVQVNNSVKGKIYVNDEYMSLSTPATLTLPVGTYKIGVGVSNDNPLDLTDDFYENILAKGVSSQYNLSGSFYEKTVTVTDGGSQTILMDALMPPLPPQNTIKIAILPFQSVMSKDMTSPLVMSQEMLDGFAEQVKVTGDRLATPTMYGLSKWEVTVLPWDTILNVNAKDVHELVGELYSVGSRPEYQHLFDKYDTVILFQSSYHADGEVEPIFAGGMTASGRLIHVTSGWTWTLPKNAVNRGLYHEMYHQYEFWETGNHHYYNGIAGLHGERLHGFTGGGASVQEYYRLFARGQAGEDYAARANFDWPVPLSEGKPFSIGVFHAARYGRLPTQ